MYGKLAMTCFKYVKKQGENRYGMVEEPSHVKQLSLNQVCKIGFTKNEHEESRGQTKKLLFLQFL